MDFRQKLFHYRSYTPIPFLIVVLVTSSSTIISVLVGFCLMILGESIRLWAVSYAGGETRTRGPVGGSTLVIDGPFAYVRNPLYLGNIFIYFGVGIMANSLGLAFIALVFFIFQYSLIVNLEEESLIKLYGSEYIKYLQIVPRFVPSFKKYNYGFPSRWDVDWKKGYASEKRTLQAMGSVVIVMLIIWKFSG